MPGHRAPTTGPASAQNSQRAANNQTNTTHLKVRDTHPLPNGNYRIPRGMQDHHRFKPPGATFCPT